MVPTDYVVLPSNGSWRIDTASPLPRPVARYRDALMATVSGRFPPNRTENVCAPGQAPQQHPPYLLILGASHSGTGAIANLLQGLGVLLSHEHVSRVYITKGGLSSWISTVKGERTFLHNGRDLEPRCKRTVTLLQVRHPRSVLRSVNGPPAWDFTYRDIRGWEWVPGPYGALWPQLSRAAKGLLWWSSFCLLAEVQLGAESVAWRMEDIFYGHDARPVHALLRLATGAPGRPTRVVAALNRAVPYNVHAKTGAKLEAWGALVRAARGQANATLRAAELNAVAVARALAMRYGYTTRR